MDIITFISGFKRLDGCLPFQLPVRIRPVSKSAPRFQTNISGVFLRLCPDSQVFEILIGHRDSMLAYIGSQRHGCRFRCFENDGIILKEIPLLWVSVLFDFNRFVWCKIRPIQEQALAGSFRSHFDVVILECFPCRQRHVKPRMAADREIHLFCIQVLHFVADRQLTLE